MTVASSADPITNNDRSSLSETHSHGLRWNFRACGLVPLTLNAET